ncbi:hypothetical protein HNQ88_002814 [Aureibacter tunicatorum]|uniref:Uncharacterized protein n=1 Tax=Aureibacter tunicatorum TaxID=866807 RepID=A0AAE3XKZ2_9BACT|nr:hypothetical protein [Aureibacter tunicatorum]BDD04241.1 hypothetical protein AUTU_17240 [Aureibacter tunicatorum]
MHSRFSLEMFVSYLEEKEYRLFSIFFLTVEIFFIRLQTALKVFYHLTQNQEYPHQSLN